MCTWATDHKSQCKASKERCPNEAFQQIQTNSIYNYHEMLECCQISSHLQRRVLSENPVAETSGKKKVGSAAAIRMTKKWTIDDTPICNTVKPKSALIFSSPAGNPHQPEPRSMTACLLTPTCSFRSPHLLPSSAAQGSFCRKVATWWSYNPCKPLKPQVHEKACCRMARSPKQGGYGLDSKSNIQGRASTGWTPIIDLLRNGQRCRKWPCPLAEGRSTQHGEEQLLCPCSSTS